MPLFSANWRRSICGQSNKFVPRQLHFIYTFGYLFKEIFPRSCAIHRFRSHRVEATPQMKIDSWAVSDVSLLSSTAREYAIKSFPFPISCCCRLMARSHTQSATLFLLRLTFKNACLVSGHTMSQTFIMQFLLNSPSVKGRTALAISATTIKLALTAASLCHMAFKNK